MQTSKFHSRKNVRRNLTQINTATTQKRFNPQPVNEPRNRNQSSYQEQMGFHGNMNSGQPPGPELQTFQPTFFPQITVGGPPHVGMNQGAGQVIQHVMIPVPVAMGTDMMATHVVAQPIGQGHLSSSQSDRESARDELNYYMSKEHISFENKNKQPRNYRNRRSSSTDSRSSDRTRGRHERRNSPDDRHSRQEYYLESRGRSPLRHRRGENFQHDSKSYSSRHRSRSQSPRLKRERHWSERDNRNRDRHYSDLRDDRIELELNRESRHEYHERYGDSHSRHADRHSGSLHDRNIERDIDSNYLRNVNEDRRQVVRREDSNLRSERSDKRESDFSDRDFHERHSFREEFRYSEKRDLSPPPQDRLSEHGSKYRRELSPVSDSRSVGELKIHISDRGRWIETDRHGRDLSPVSELESRDSRHRGFERRMVNDRVTVENIVDGDTLVSDTETVSDEETFSDNFENLRNWERDEFYRQSSDQNRIEHQRKDDYHMRDEIDIVSRKSTHHSESSNDWRDSRVTIKLPNNAICSYFNKNIYSGCKNPNCMALHVCKRYVLESCKYGDACNKSHSFFTGQPYKVLKELNPDLENTRGMHQKIICQLQRRILIACGRLDLLKVIEEKEKALDKQLRDKEYTKGHGYHKLSESDRMTVGSRAYSDDRESSVHTRPERRTDTIHTNKGGISHAENYSRRHSNEHLSRKDRTSQESGKRENNERKDLSPVSGDEGNWDDYEKYEKVSDDGIEKSLDSPNTNTPQQKQQEENKVDTKSSELNQPNKQKSNRSSLDAVSPSRSDDGLNKPLDFPVPTPENIAVPIGQNDPLVFNRPLGNKPENYIGPLNRPPPSVPLIPGPLFPIMGQQQQQANASLPNINIRPPPLPMQGPPPNTSFPPPVVGLPGRLPGPGTVMRPGLLPQRLPGQVPMPVPAPRMGPISGPAPNHLPTPEFMKQVIQNLPVVQNTFKNDNNPTVIEAVTETKKKPEKVVKDPELKETIKSLWKFPHKSVVSLSIIEFVTETEAYKEEFVAEIIKLLVTLELPYVTMKKLMSIIKEKMLINIASETDMRKILDMYSANFKIIETADSDDEDDEAVKRVQIKANVALGFCEKHGFLPFAIGKCDCNALHICKFYLLSDCPNKQCKFGHKLKIEHNINVLKNHKLHRLTGEELVDFLSDIDNRNKYTVPSLCRYYTREKGCYKGDNTETDTICHSLHICYYAFKGKCLSLECDRAHNIRAKQPLSLLQKFGLDPDIYGDKRITQLITDIVIENEKEKHLKGSVPKKAPQKAGGVLIDDKAKKPGLKKGKLVKPPVSETPAQPASKDKSKTQTESVSTGKPDVSTGVSKPRATVKVPAICKFYQNEMGCRKKDWGPEGKCLFLHVCKYFVAGECNFGDKCKRSHNLYSGQVAELLREYNIHTECLSVNEILGLLNQTDTIVEFPMDDEKEDVSVDSAKHKDVKSPKKETGVKQVTNPKAAEKKVENISTSSNETQRIRSDIYQSHNIEDVIKHIMEERRVDKVTNLSK